MYRDNILKANKVMNKLLYLLLIAVCWSCSQDSETEKHQSKRDQVVDVRDKMKEFSTQDVLIGRISRTYLIDNYLIVTDYNSPDKLIHLFDKNTQTKRFGDFLFAVAPPRQM